MYVCNRRNGTQQSDSVFACLGISHGNAPRRKHLPVHLLLQGRTCLREGVDLFVGGEGRGGEGGDGGAKGCGGGGEEFMLVQRSQRDNVA